MEKSEVKCSEHNLSVHDKTILDRIFNPNLPVSDLEEEQLEDIGIKYCRLFFLLTD